MFSKIIAIAWTNIYITFSDRGALVLMLLIPIALSTLIALAFGQVGGEIDLQAAQVMVINQDQGVALFDTNTNWGSVYVDVLTENDPAGLGKVLLGEVGTDIETARRMVEDGEINAVVVIPPDFSQQLGAVEVYYNPGESIGATIVLSVVQQITAQLNAGQVAQDTLLGEPPTSNRQAADIDAMGYWIRTALERDTLSDLLNNLPTITQSALQGIFTGENQAPLLVNTVNVEGEAEEIDWLQYFAPGMAILFMTFAMAAGTRGILEENVNWTLQRLMTTPTPRWVYMFGKLLGTYASGLIQMAILLVVTPLIALLLGRGTSVWGDNYPGLVLVTLAVVGAATGLGLLLTAISKTPRQADNYASAVILVMAMLGGTFVPTENVAVLKSLSNLSLNKWGLQGYTELAANGASVGEIAPVILVLAGMGAAFFLAALWQFNRRLDI